MRNAVSFREEYQMKKIGGKALLLAASVTLAAGCQQSETQDDQQAKAQAQGENATGATDGNIAQALSRSSDLSTFVSAVKTAGLDATMAGSQPYTVFAPNNAAFQKLPEGTAEGLMQPDQKGQLTTIITHHIVPGVVTAQDLSRAIEKGGGKADVATVGGGNLTASQDGGTIVLTGPGGGQARVMPSDQAQSNGVVHTVDTVLMPS